MVVMLIRLVISMQLRSMMGIIVVWIFVLHVSIKMMLVEIFALNETSRVNSDLSLLMFFMVTVFNYSKFVQIITHRLELATIDSTNSMRVIVSIMRMLGSYMMLMLKMRSFCIILSHIRMLKF